VNPRVTYLTVDSLAEGVGSSQVLPYVEGLARRGTPITLHSFERGSPAPEAASRLREAGVDWRVHRFGREGHVGGTVRMLRGAWAVRHAGLVHARGDLPGLAASLRRSRPFVWDMRGFWVDERIETGSIRRGSIVERLLRRSERRLARRSARVITLSRAAMSELRRRYDDDVAGKVTVIPTCVDLGRFQMSPLPPDPTVVMLAGTLNVRYDVPLMVRFVERLRADRDVVFDVVTPAETPWAVELARAGAVMSSARPPEMPTILQRATVCLSVVQPFPGTETAQVPTKIAEALACGRPIVVNQGLGDLDEILAEFDCGVVLGASPAELDDAAARLDALLADPDTPARCRRAAETEFDLVSAIGHLEHLYRSMEGD
jgi:glycosyltransferase involved in cell wall biosynthesis